jgi:predicted SAM-dependent methyltransferase
MINAIGGERAQRMLDHLSRPPKEVGFQSQFRRMLKFVPQPVVRQARFSGTALLRPLSRRRFATDRNRSDTRLHLACGFNPKAGWLNVDLIGAKADLFWDLRRGFPLADGTVDAIFHEHFLEHLPLDEGFRLSRECRRVLKPDGVLRIGVPDVGSLLQRYSSGDPDTRGIHPTALLEIASMFYDYGHVAMYDFETLEGHLMAAGFRNVERRSFGEGRVQPSPDSEARRPETLYVEAWGA